MKSKLIEWDNVNFQRVKERFWFLVDAIASGIKFTSAHVVPFFKLRYNINYKMYKWKIKNTSNEFSRNSNIFFFLIYLCFLFLPFSLSFPVRGRILYQFPFFLFIIISLWAVHPLLYFLNLTKLVWKPVWMNLSIKVKETHLNKSS